MTTKTYIQMADMFRSEIVRATKGDIDCRRAKIHTVENLVAKFCEIALADNSRFEKAKFYQRVYRPAK